MELTIEIEENVFADQLSLEITAGGLTVVDAIEKVLGEHLEACVSQSMSDNLIKAPKSTVHPSYYVNRFENLANLRKRGYSTWYPEVRFSTRKSEALEIDNVKAIGLDLGYIRYGGGIERQFTYRRKELKTQVNHVLRLNQTSVPSAVFEKTVYTVTGTTAIKQPYIANLTVGCENFVDDRIKGFRTVSFDHLLTGERRFCQCHQKAHATMVSDAEAMASSYVPGSWPHRIIDLLEHATYKDGCCHFCISERYGQEAHFEWYGSQIRQHFGPYVDLLVRDAGLDKRTAIAETRRRLSISRWVRQDQLCDLVAKIFSTHVIRREASPPWLGLQRLDIYLPELALAIEHQGQQHYYPIAGFGGEHAFARTQERDERKRALCTENGVTVIEIRYDEPLSMPYLRSRLRRWLVN